MFVCRSSVLADFHQPTETGCTGRVDAQRQDPAPPIQMSDALARNTPGAHPTEAASCIPHGRRRLVTVHEAFPDAVVFVLETLRPVFRTDQQAK
jgi:transposase